MQLPDTMDFLIEQARRKRDLAAARAAQALRVVQDAEGQLALLDRYRDEYRQRWTGLAQRGTSISELATHRDFLSRLDIAIQQQGVQIERTREAATEMQEQLIETERRLQPLIRVQDNRAAAVAHAERRREQQADDETAANAARRAAGQALI